MDPTTTLLPMGSLRLGDAGAISIQIRADRPARKAIRTWLDRLGTIHSRWLLLPRRTSEEAHGFDVEYPDDARTTVGLDSSVTEFVRDLPVAVPRIVGLIQFMLDAAAELLGHEVEDVLWAPAVVRSTQGSNAPWRLIPLPTIGCNLADWARADPSSWPWTPPGRLLGSPEDLVSYAVGAALQGAMVGTSFPEILPSREVFARALRGRSVMSARLDAAARSALPRSRVRDAEGLVNLALDCLSPDPKRRPDPIALRERFGAIDANLRLEQLIRAWEFEGQAGIAAKLGGHRRRGEPTDPPPEPPPNQEWNDIARKLRDGGDLRGALEAAWNAMRLEGAWHIRIYLGIVQLFASRLSPTRSELVAMIERVPEVILDGLDEADALRLAHIKSRYLNAHGAELGRLDRSYASRWVEATSLLIRARDSLRVDSAYVLASQACLGARKLYEAMPQAGGPAGLYARAYVDLLDGISHIGAIGLYRDLSFCTDAFRLFTDCFRRATQADSESLAKASLDWLGWLANLTRGSTDAPLSLIHAGIEGILRSQEIPIEAIAQGGIPEIPWYDEDVIFAL